MKPDFFFLGGGGGGGVWSPWISLSKPVSDPPKIFRKQNISTYLCQHYVIAICEHTRPPLNADSILFSYHDNFLWNSAVPEKSRNNLSSYTSS